MAKRLRTLGVWLDGDLIANLEQRHWNELRLRYSPQALERWPLNSPVISCSLPLSAGPQDARAFCSGLLPEGQALQALAARAGIAAHHTFDLLARYGRDVAGALVVGDALREPSAADVETYSTASLEQAVDELDEFPLGAHDDSELSLAGLQDKLLLVELPGGGWGRPLHGRPSTHILKVDDRRRPGLVAAEAAALSLAERVGLSSIDPQLESIAGTDCLIVRRFDRVLAEDGSVGRIHQEDLCQAMGVNHVGPTGKGKYEFAGGPGFRDAARLLDTYASDSPAELDRLVATVAFTVAIGNADAHAKNVAFLHSSGQAIRLAPLYDTVPTVLWPRLRARLAMSVNGRDAAPTVTLDDVVAEAGAWPHERGRARRVAVETLEALIVAVEDEVVPSESPVGRFVVQRSKELLVGRS